LRFCAMRRQAEFRIGRQHNSFQAIVNNGLANKNFASRRSTG
jgi:hypothetical protein